LVPDSIVEAPSGRLRPILGALARYLSAEFRKAGQRFGATPWGSAQRIGGTRAPCWRPSPICFQPRKWWVNTRSRSLCGWADPDLLYARQRERLMVFRRPIVAAAGISLAERGGCQSNLNEPIPIEQQKSNFVSSVSHELRAPIASVRLMAESLEARQNLRTGETERVFPLHRPGMSAALGTHRKRSGLFPASNRGVNNMSLEPTDLAALVRETVEAHGAVCAEKRCELELGTSNIQHPTSNIELNVDGRALHSARQPDGQRHQTFAEG